MLRKLSVGAVAACALLAAGVDQGHAADKIKLGFITTLTGPGAAIGKHQQDAVNLALEQRGSKLGDVAAEVIFADDQQKPEVGKQVADELLKKHNVDFIAGVIWSNVMLAIYNPIVRNKTIFIGANAGPTNIAGEDCSPYFFSASLINDQPPEALGQCVHHLDLEAKQVSADADSSSESSCITKIVRRIAHATPFSSPSLLASAPRDLGGN